MFCTTTFTNITNIIGYLTCVLVRAIVPLLITIAVVSFIWGIVQMMLNPTNEEARKKGKSFMLWGLISLFVMISVWGLVNIFSDTFGLPTLIPQLSQTAS